MNLAVFASGRGSNFQAILRAIDEHRLDARVMLALSNRSDAGALDTARARGIPACHCSHTQFSGEETFISHLLAVLREHNVETIALAGYLKRIPRAIVGQFHNRIVNIHPALLPSFGGPGMFGHHVHEAVIASGVKVTGATVHLVDEEYDRGPILLQRAVDIVPDDTPETIAAKVLVVEHQIFPLALQAMAEGRIAFQGNRAWIK